MQALYPVPLGARPLDPQSVVVAGQKQALTMSPQHQVVTSMAFLLAHLQALWGGQS